MSTRIKVSLAFQLSADTAVVRRKKVLSFQFEDSLQKLYETISGHLGGAPLWPKDFGDRLQGDDAVAQFFFNPGGEQSGEGDASAALVWHPAPAGGVLGDLARGAGASAVADVLLRIVEPPERDANGGEDQVPHLDGTYYSRTFLHFKEDDDSKAPTPRAVSDPGSYHCSTPHSRVASEVGNDLGLMEQKEQERNHRTKCEEYIQKKLLPHLGKKGEQGEVPNGGRHALSCRSPLRIGTPVLNLDAMSLPRRQTEQGEPAYVAPGPPQVTTSLANPPGVVHHTEGNAWAGMIPQPVQSPHVAPFEDDDDDAMVMPGFPGSSLATTKADELFDVVSRNDMAALQLLIDSGVDVNECTAKGSHVLFRAVIKARELEIVHVLLRAGADVRSRDEKGNQVMHFWARATVGRNFLLDMGRSLLLVGADVNAQRFNDGMSPLHHTVVGHNNRRGWLDFHKALMLVRHGANIHLRTHVGQLPLSLVAVDGRAATKKLVQLLQYGIPEGSTDWPRCEHLSCPWCT